MIIKKINDWSKFLPFYFLSKFNKLFIYLSSIEDIILSKKISEIKIKRIVVTGYPRSGTTFLTELINNDSEVGSFLYRDLPFVFNLYFWNKLSKFYYYGLKNTKRSHGDKILINPNSPDSFEEILWSSFIKDYKKNGYKKIIDEQYYNKKLENFININIKKLMLIRGNSKYYLSKGNYLLFRLKYIEKINPESKFIICIRNPIDQCISAVNTNKLFYNHYKNNFYYKMETDSLCHFEFGFRKKSLMELNPYTNEKPEDLILNYKYYLEEWLYTYSFILREYINNKKLKEKILIINYDKLNINSLNEIYKFCGLNNYEIIMKYFKDNFSQSTYSKKNEIITNNDEEIINMENKAKDIFYTITETNHNLK